MWLSPFCALSFQERVCGRATAGGILHSPRPQCLPKGPFVHDICVYEAADGKPLLFTRNWVVRGRCIRTHAFTHFGIYSVIYGHECVPMHAHILCTPSGMHGVVHAHIHASTHLCMLVFVHVQIRAFLDTPECTPTCMHTHRCTHSCSYMNKPAWCGVHRAHSCQYQLLGSALRLAQVPHPMGQ